MSTSDSPALDWRSKIIECLVNLHISLPGSQLYGVEHALAVEEGALASVTESGTDEHAAGELTILRCAALLHDIGFAHHDEAWSVDGFEHLAAGQRLATEILYTIPALWSDAEKIARILSLVAHHDDTVYAFPATTNGNGSRSVKWPLSNSGADKLLLILREADSFIHAGNACVAEATREWEVSGIPPLPARGTPLATWRWMDSIAGNLRLLAKRVLVDACSQMERRQHMKHTRGSSRRFANVARRWGSPMSQKSARRRCVATHSLDWRAGHSICNSMLSITGMSLKTRCDRFH